MQYLSNRQADFCLICTSQLYRCCSAPPHPKRQVRRLTESITVGWPRNCRSVCLKNIGKNFRPLRAQSDEARDSTLSGGAPVGSSQALGTGTVEALSLLDASRLHKAVFGKTGAPAVSWQRKRWNPQPVAWTQAI